MAYKPGIEILPGGIQLHQSGTRGILPDVRKVMDEVIAEAAKAGHKIRIVHGSTTWADHNTYRCIDWMIPNKAAGDWIANYILKHRSRLGARFMVWNDRVIRAYPKGNIPAWKWASYQPDNPKRHRHYDHVHLEIQPGFTYRAPGTAKPAAAAATTQKATAPAAAPKATATTVKAPTSGKVYLDKLRPGVTNSDSVWYWRMALNAIRLRGGSELKLTRDYTNDLVRETKLFQAQKANDPTDGWPGPRQAQLAFGLAQKEMKSKGVRTLSIFRDSKKSGGLVKRVW